MNRKYTIIFIITGIAIIGLIGGVFAYKYYSSFKKVTVIVQQQDITADIYRRNPNNDDSGNDTRVGTVKGTQVLSLQPAKYYAISEGDKYDKSEASFIVNDKDVTINVNPGYSSTYLTSILTQERSSIKAVITAKYSGILGDFTINDGKLYHDGSWYGTTLVQKSPAPGENGDVYRTVLHKVGNNWQFAATPEIILTSPSHPDIPFDILTDLNGQSGY